MRRRILASLAKSGYTAKDYVQDGLFVMWDGIENAGWGVHDAQARTWMDLCGNRNATLRSNAVFTGDALRNDVPEGMATFDTVTTRWRTLEIVAKIDTINIGIFGWMNNAADPDGAAFNLFSATNIISTGRYNGLSSLAVRIAFGKRRSYVFTKDVAGNTTHSYEDGKRVDSSGSNSWYQLGRTIGGYSSRYMLGEFCAIRVRTEELSDAEIAANYAIDKARFNLPDAA